MNVSVRGWVLLLAMQMAPEIRADDPQALLAQARRADQMRQWTDSARLCDQVIQQNADLAEAYYWRGRARYCLSQFAKSVADFDQYVKRKPAAASRQWERGIACYYAGQFEAGAKQFALYQSYHDNDVENSVWRYLCMARIKTQGVTKAREAILPIRNDPRPGMMKIYDLYRGKATVEEVLETVKKGNPTEEQLSGRLYYARLYIGLFYEAQGEAKLARKYINLASDQHQKDAEEDRVNHYMYDVAVVHQKLLAAKDKPKQ